MIDTSIPRCNVLGIGVHAVNMSLAVQAIVEAVSAGRKGYVCLAGAHGIVDAQRNPAIHKAYNSAFLNAPDGMPLVWVGRAQGFRDMQRVYGPDLMMAVCERSVREGWRHFLYGGNPGVAEKLQAVLQERFPGIVISGTFTPPFRPLNSEEEVDLRERVQKQKPDFFWVGLSSPKQELFMAQYLPKLDTKVMFGVGAAFDYWTGTLKDSPAWIKRAGLQWAHRLIQEPRRLWRRYAYAVPAFLVLILLQALGLKKYRLAA